MVGWLRMLYSHFHLCLSEILENYKGRKKNKNLNGSDFVGFFLLGQIHHCKAGIQ
jgi:hypothetical protein